MARRKLVIPRPVLVPDPKSGIFQVSYTHPKLGYTVKKSTGERERAKAESAMLAMVGDIMGIGPSSDTYTVGELLTAYEGSKDHVANGERHALPRLHQFFDSFRPDQLVDTAWRRYRKWRTGQDQVHAPALLRKEKGEEPRKVSDSTACRELAVMRSAISWARRNPQWKGLDHVRVTLPDTMNVPRHEYLSKDDARLLIDNCVELHQRLFTLLALATAGRHRAILDLKWSNITWPQGSAPQGGDKRFETRPVSEVIKGATWVDDVRVIDFDKSSMKGPIHVDLGRASGNKRKPIAVVHPSNVRLYDALREAYRVRKSDHVIEWRGEKVSRIDLSDAYRRAGLPRPAAPQHVLKHTAISWMVQDGKPLASIAALTRTSVQTIEKVYGHLSPKHIEVVGDVLTL